MHVRPSPCRKEWDDLFLHSNYQARIRQAGINGQLRSSRFRSVCWKVRGPSFPVRPRSLPVVTACTHLLACLSVCQLYLEALPEDKGQWINKTKELRGLYEKIKETVRAPPCGQYNQTNKPPPKEVCSSCLS